MQIGLVLADPLDLDHLGLASDWIGYSGHIASKHPHLLVSSPGFDLLHPDCGNGGVALLSAYLMLSLAPGGNQFPSRGLPSKFALPTHIIIPQIANSL